MVAKREKVVACDEAAPASSIRLRVYRLRVYRLEVAGGAPARQIGLVKSRRKTRFQGRQTSFGRFKARFPPELIAGPFSPLPKPKDQADVYAP